GLRLAVQEEAGAAQTLSAQAHGGRGSVRLVRLLVRRPSVPRRARPQARQKPSPAITDQRGQPHSPHVKPEVHGFVAFVQYYVWRICSDVEPDALSLLSGDVARYCGPCS